MRRLTRLLLRFLPRLLAAGAFGATMFRLRDCCSHWSYPALFMAMYAAMGVMALAMIVGDRQVDRWLDQRQHRQNDKGPAKPGP